MNNPGLYTSVNNLQKRDAQLVLDLVKPMLPWNSEEHILDVGCGPGDLTASLLKSYLPQDAHIVGCDISESMVTYAQATFGDEHVRFKQLDIGNPNIWMNWDEASFDKIFSFYCLNWVNNQKQAAQNMHSLLKKHGSLVTMFTTEHPFIHFFEYLSSHPKFANYSKVWNTWDVLSEKSGKDPKEEYMKILKSCNFEIVSCTTKNISFSHKSMEDFTGYFESVNPFVKKIPPNEAKSFLEECIEKMLEQKLLKVKEDGEVIHEYDVLITLAKKQ